MSLSFLYGEKDAKLELLCKNFVIKLKLDSIPYIDFLLDEYKELRKIA